MNESGGVVNFCCYIRSWPRWGGVGGEKTEIQMSLTCGSGEDGAGSPHPLGWG